MQTTCRLKKKTPLAESLSQWKLHLDGFGPPVRCVSGIAGEVDPSESQLVGG